MGRRRSLRAALAWLLVTVLLPLTAAGVALLAHEWKQERAVAVARLLEHARTLRRAVDRELSLDLAVLRTLAASREIDQRNWRAFHALATEAAEARPGSWFALYEPGGQNVVNTRVPFGEPLPNLRQLRSTRVDAEWEGRTVPLLDLKDLFGPLETRQPTFSGIVYGVVTGRPAVGAMVPVMRGGSPVYVLALVYSSQFFEALLQRERTPGLTAGIWDQRGLFVARNRDSENFVARPGPPPFKQGAAQLLQEGVGEDLNVEAVPYVYAYSRSTVADYVVAAGMPRADVLAPAWRALWLWLAVLVCAGAAGAFMASRLWRRIVTPLAALAQQARSLGERDIEVQSSEIDEVDALRVALLGAANDVTERKRAEAALRDANAKLQDADRRKDEFLGMLSHELRNPLAPIRNSIHVLHHADPTSPEAGRARAVIARQSEHLTRIVEDLLDVTRIVRGKILLQRERVELRTLVARAAEDAHLAIEQRGVKLRVELPAQDLWTDGDSTRITQVLGNLLTNANKFTREGDEIVLGLRDVDGAAEIRVRDTGAGIDPDLLPNLFSAFVQGKRTLARSEGGLGLGLALVKALVELHGGSVRAHSEGQDQGAEFVVTLPLAKPRVG